MTVADAFLQYKSNLEITKTEEDLASRRQVEIRNVVNKAFDLETDFLTGSYKRDTATKPLKDVDVFCVLKTTDMNLKKYRQSGADVVLESLQQVLERAYPKRTEVGRRSVSVSFGPEERIMSFDVILAFERKGGGYEIPDNTSAGPWIATDPTIHATKATEKNKAFDNEWKPLVKMIKGWRRHHKKPIRPSFLIEVMALELVEPPFNNYEWELQSFFATAANYITRDWPDPSGLGPTVNDAMTLAEKTDAVRLLREASEAAAAARRLASKDEHAAIRAWRDLLGPLFPVP